MKKKNHAYQDSISVSLPTGEDLDVTIGFDVDWAEVETGTHDTVTCVQVLLIDGVDTGSDEFSEFVPAIDAKLSTMHDRLIEAAAEIDLIHDERKEETQFDFA